MGPTVSFLDRKRVDQQRKRRCNAHLSQNGLGVRFPGLMDDRRLWEDYFCFPSFHNDLLSLTDQ
jgi:hypothetical protein